MSLKNIEKYSASYAIFKYWVKFWHDKVFYRKVEYIHRENVPANEHLIFTANHQNALMDALAIELSFYNQPVFVARSDIFSNKLIASILYWLKILPVYRIRDGYESLKKNDIVFQKTIDIILNKNNFVIMPEGNHAGYRHLRQLKKGFARIAFQTEDANNYSLHIKIIPVGIDYGCYTSYRSTLLVNFGKPIDVSNFYNDYKANNAIALNKIRNVLSEQLKPLMINIESEKYYNLYDELRKMYRQYGIKKKHLNPKSLYDGFVVDKQLIAGLEKIEKKSVEKMEYYAKLMKIFTGIRKKTGLGVFELSEKSISLFNHVCQWFFLVIIFPIFIYGFIVNGLPYHIPRYIVSSIKDKQFHSSFKYVLTMILFPVFYILETGIFYLYVLNWLNTALFFISLPLSAIISWQWYIHYKILTGRLKYLIFRSKKSKEFVLYMDSYKQLINFADTIFE